MRRYERKYYTRSQGCGADHNQLSEMQHSPNNRHGAPGNSNGASSSHASRVPGEGSCPRERDVHIHLGSPTEETIENSNSRHHPHLGTQSHSCAHSHGEARGPDDGGLDSEEQSGNSFSELRCLLKWLHKSLPYLLILSLKLFMQHITGISLGIGLLTTFIYANKSIVNQVFLRERYAKLQCAWLVVLLMGSSVLLYYTFYSQSLHYSLILLSPTVDVINFWEVLWIVGITDFILKFLFMSLKCIVLLVPLFIMSLKSKDYWYMLLEEICQYYRKIAPIPVWFRYFIGLRETDGMLGWSLGILLALLYLILKLLSFFGHLKNFKRVLKIFYTRPSYGVAATKRQCVEVDDICSICQAEFQKPVLFNCQHIFCEDCIGLWFNKEKTCPLCRTVISDHIYKWKDGATSVHLQVY